MQWVLIAMGICFAVLLSFAVSWKGVFIAREGVRVQAFPDISRVSLWLDGCATGRDQAGIRRLDVPYTRKDTTKLFPSPKQGRKPKQGLLKKKSSKMMVLFGSHMFGQINNLRTACMLGEADVGPSRQLFLEPWWKQTKKARVILSRLLP